MTQSPSSTPLADLHAEVARAFGLGVPRAPMVLSARGEQGVIWRLDTGSGSYAVKELLMPLTESAAATDVEFLETAYRLRSFITPRPVRAVDGSVLADVGGRSVRVQTWVDIEPENVFLEPARVGRMLAELHGAGEPRSDAVHPWYTAAVGEARWNECVAALRAAKASPAESIAATVPTLLELESMLVPPTNPRMCHRDLWADNVRSTPADELCVIDWDNSGPADPSHELGMVLFEFAGDDEERAGALYDAYLTGGGPGRIADYGSFTMLIAQFGHFYEMAIAVWADPNPKPEDVTWALGRLAMLESQPLTVEGLSRLIHATAR